MSRMIAHSFVGSFLWLFQLMMWWRVPQVKEWSMRILVMQPRQELPLRGRREWKKKWRCAEKKPSPWIKWVTVWMLNVLCRRWEREESADTSRFYTLDPLLGIKKRKIHWLRWGFLRKTQMWKWASQPWSLLWFCGKCLVSCTQPSTSMNLRITSGRCWGYSLHTLMHE